MLMKNSNLEQALSLMASSSTVERRKGEEKRGNLRTNLNKGLLFGSDINTNCRCHGQRHDNDMTVAFAHFKSNCRCHG